MSKKYDWEFPLPRTHTGMLLGNGTLGAMLWGTGQVLCVTIGRADYWDHRGGVRWNEQMSYANIRACLEAGDEKRLGELFAVPSPQPGEPKYPSVLPIGRLEIDFGEGAVLTSGTLNLSDGSAVVRLTKGGREYEVGVTLAMHTPVIALELPSRLAEAEIRPVTSWNYVGEYLRSISFPEPEAFTSAHLSGWVQQRPADPPLCVAYRRQERDLFITAVYGEDPSGAQQVACRTIDAVDEGGYRGVRKANRQWWRAYWKSTAAVKVPNERLQFLYDYGMYKFAGLTNPDGVPATLQGPWIEEYQMPPWSSDYHFNINVQMCYWPAYHGNRLAHLKPMFEMVAGWTDTLRHNARVFLGLEDGRMLPHAVDDRGTCIGGFWGGSLDHGCTAWVAQMMYRYYRYTLDEAFLRETAYPFMLGTLRVYEGMMEKDGDRYVLPVSVSPEYHTKGTRSPWGRNASFQLACIHRLLEDLQDAAKVLGAEPEPQWAEIQTHLPKACLISNDGGEQIAIWEGIELEESHRHHSHLAGLAPFDIFDIDDPAWRPILVKSIGRWIYRGPGLWSGWCVPWASMLHQRCNNGDAAELFLEIWERVFTNEGHGTLHDFQFPGFTLMGPGAVPPLPERPEIMQMDAGMACATAIQEMLLHTRRGVNYLFAGAPRRWKKTSFQRMRTDGAFLVSATAERGVVQSITVESPAGGNFTLANPWDGPVTVLRKGKVTDTYTGPTLTIPTSVGETIEIQRG